MPTKLDSRQSVLRTALGMVGSAANDTVESILLKIDPQLAKLFEDRNVLLTDGGLITFTGTDLIFTEDLNIVLNQKISGAAPMVISLGDATQVFADGDMWYAIIDRGAGTATTAIAATLPAAIAANQEIFLIAKRVDAGDGLRRVYFRSGMAMDEGQTARLGASGSGSGSGNETLETLKNAFVDSPYELMTPNIFSTDEDDKVDPASTGEFSLVTKTYQLGIGETLVSTQSLDPEEFLASPSIVGNVDLSVFWAAEFVDTAATYEVSRDGGNEWQEVEMARIGSNTEVYRGTHSFEEEAAKQDLVSQTSQSTSIDFTASSTNQSLAQKVVLAAASVVKQVTLRFAKTGSPAGNIFVSLVKDAAGVPSTDIADLLCESAAVPVSGIVNATPFAVDLPDTAVAAGTYHIVVRTDATYKASYSNGVTEIGWANATTGTLASTYDGTIWAASGTNSFYAVTQGSTLDLRVRVTASMASQLAGYGIMYALSSTGISQSSQKNREVRYFAGADNVSSFTLSFLPDPDLLKVYDVYTGQVYTNGAFTLNGYTVQFTAGQFLSANFVMLVFEQIGTANFDNSDQNAALLAANHLGSTDVSIDRSLPGRGIYLRRPDGTLRELRLDNDDNIVVEST